MLEADEAPRHDRGSLYGGVEQHGEQFALVPDRLLKYRIEHSPLGVIEWGQDFRISR